MDFQIEKESFHDILVSKYIIIDVRYRNFYYGYVLRTTLKFLLNSNFSLYFLT